MCQILLRSCQARLELPAGIEPECLSVTLTRVGSMEWVQETEGEEVKMRVIGNSFKEWCHKKGTDNLPGVRRGYRIKDRKLLQCICRLKGRSSRGGNGRCEPPLYTYYVSGVVLGILYGLFNLICT